MWGSDLGGKNELVISNLIITSANFFEAGRDPFQTRSFADLSKFAKFLKNYFKINLPSFVSVMLHTSTKSYQPCSLPAEVENNLKFPLHMDYLVLF